MMKSQNSKKKQLELVVLAGAQKHLNDICCWPNDGQKLNNIKIILPFLMIALPLLMGVFGHIYQSFNGHNISAVVNDICYVGIGVSLFTSGAIFINIIEKLVDLVKRLNEHKYGIPENFGKIKTELERITTFFYIYITFVSIILIIVTYFMDSECFLRKKQGRLPGQICGMYLSVWYPKEVGYTPWLQMIWISYLILAVIYIPKLCVAVTVYYGCLHITINRMNHLTYLLKKITFVGRDIHLLKQELIFYVKYYSEIVELVDDINSTVGLILSPYQNIFSILVISLMEYQTIVERKPLGFMAFFGWLLVQAVACYEGQRLENSSELLRKQVYDIPWYDLDPSMRSNFRMFHIQIQKTLNFKIPPLIVMNLVYFYSVMKGSYSFMMYLKGL